MAALIFLLGKYYQSRIQEGGDSAGNINEVVDLGKLKQSLRAKRVSIPREQVMVKIFKVKPGAMTAFGGLHKVEVWVDRSLLKTKEIILSAGSFTDSVRMKAKDFIELEQAKLANFAKSGGYKLQVKPSKKSSKRGAAKRKK